MRVLRTLFLCVHLLLTPPQVASSISDGGGVSVGMLRSFPSRRSRQDPSRSRECPADIRRRVGGVSASAGIGPSRDSTRLAGKEDETGVLVSESCVDECAASLASRVREADLAKGDWCSCRGKWGLECQPHCLAQRLGSASVLGGLV